VVRNRNVGLLSRVTPSVFTVSESGTEVSARQMLESKGKECRGWYALCTKQNCLDLWPNH